jgi:hypothetical protein
MSLLFNLPLVEHRKNSLSLLSVKSGLTLREEHRLRILSCPRSREHYDLREVGNHTMNDTASHPLSPESRSVSQLYSNMYLRKFTTGI